MRIGRGGAYTNAMTNRCEAAWGGRKSFASKELRDQEARVTDESSQDSMLGGRLTNRDSRSIATEITKLPLMNTPQRLYLLGHKIEEQSRKGATKFNTPTRKSVYVERRQIKMSLPEVAWCQYGVVLSPLSALDDVSLLLMGLPDIPWVLCLGQDGGAGQA
ncbi:hypothetical protein SISNIDRAFT_463593 [Sistotremastrum niveocremeum HHB9708]|uniref:Uncharacterized protein n=1 Tax=Sistotremastrum niveocremeum HHB9708 TaxID=1314777 RepID=A0A164YET8_9AGAM|nr:hypothetical protein SISNIDRAFT_463593 [Sistotremastrum niveocremeum HHB9708]